VQEVNVCSKVKAFWDEGMENSNVIYLPWVPGIYQEIEMKAIGGWLLCYTDICIFFTDFWFVI
jgi:nuclear pore complex protein Nup210